MPPNTLGPYGRRSRSGLDAGVVVVTVTDDGIGGANAAAGTGLAGLADRVAALGGRLRVTSAPGGGTRVDRRSNAGRENR